MSISTNAPKAIITGITGQDGAYLSKLLLERGFDVVGILRINEEPNAKRNLAYLNVDDRITYYQLDLLDKLSVENFVARIKPSHIFNLAAQSSVANSFKNPGATLEFNINSVMNLLEAILTVDKKIKFYQASSSEMFGVIKSLPIRIDFPMNPVSPYAVSKAAAHWMVKSYRKAYGLFAVSGVLFNHESYLRGKDFFCKKVIRHALEISRGKRQFLELGNIDVRRDFGYAPDYVEAMFKMLEQEIPKDYIISSGRSISLREIVYKVFDYFCIGHDKIKINPELCRQDEIIDIFGDCEMAKRELDWKYDKKFEDILELLIAEELKNYQEVSV